MAEWFEEWFGETYLEMYPHRDEHDAATAVSLIAEVAPMAQRRVLDLACGPGRHSNLLRQHAGSVVGLDLSMPLLRRARAGHSPPPAVTRGDMRALPFAESCFDVVVNLFTSFGYFDTDEEHFQVLREVARILTAGGWFVLDYLNAASVRDSLVRKEETTLGDHSVAITRAISGDGRFVVKNMRLIEEDRLYQERVRLFEFHELESMLAEVGFVVRERFGSYAGAALSAESQRMLIFAVKS